MSRDVLVIQHEPAEGLGRIEPVLRERGLTPTVVRRDLSESLPEPSDAESLAALVVLGGSAGVGDITDRSELADELAFVRQALAMDLPTLGICLGSQLMAQALGSTRWTGEWELGWHEVSGPTTKVPSIELPDRFSALHWHRDRFSTPPGAENLASTAGTPCQVFSKGPHLGVLFHLEADVEQTTAMAENLSSDLTEAGQDPDQLLDDTRRFARTTAVLADSVFGSWADLVQARRRPYG